MLTPELVAETTAAYSKVVAGMPGGKPIDILVKGAEGNARLRAARLNLGRAMTTQKYVRAGLQVRAFFEGESSKDSAVLSDAETTEARRFGVLVMLAGGVEACKMMSGVEEVKQAAATARRLLGAAGRQEQQRRAEVMLLCAVGEKGGHMTYTLGKGKDYWELWNAATATPQDRLKWTALMLKTAEIAVD